MINEQAYIQDCIKRKARHEIHTSERKSFRGCRRRWRWIYIENYYPITTPKPLEFGIAYHKAMEVLHNPTTWRFPNEMLRAMAEQAFVDTCEAQRKTYLQHRDLYGLDTEEQEDYDDRIELGRGMIRYYVENQLNAIREEFTPTHVEVSFDVPLKDENGKQLYCKCGPCRKAFARTGGGKWYGNPVVASGRVDMVVCDSQGGYWIWDFKTAARLSTTEVFLEIDDQIATYCWALGMAMGLNIMGFLYHEQLKGYPVPPKRNKVMRLGRMYSVAANQTTDYEIYLQTVQENDKEAYDQGLYDDFLNLLKEVGIRYYARFKVYKTDYELWQVHMNLLGEAREMLDLTLSHYPSPGRFSCGGCAFQVPCISKNQGQDFQYTLETMYIKQEPYYRRFQPMSTDKRGDV